MTDYIHFSDTDPNVQLAPSWAEDSRYPASTRPSHRSQVSNMSWISSSMLQPPYPTPYPGQPPTPRPRNQPSPASRGMSATTTSQWRGSEQALETTPEYPTPEREVDQEQHGRMMEERGLGAGSRAHTEQELATTEPSAENFDFSADDMEAGVGYGQAGKGKGFGGRLVAGLRSLPKVITRNPLHERKVSRKGTTELYNLDISDTALPRYEGPGEPVPGPSNVQYVQAMQMPTEQPASTQLSYTDDNGDNLSNVPLENPHETLSGELVQPPQILTSPGPLSSPVPVEPKPTSDYAKMESPVRVEPPDDSFSAHITRIHNFLVDLKNLPWMSSRVTVDYYPGRSPRARDPKIESSSWYTTRQHQHIDLIDTPAPAKTELQRQRGYDAQSLHRRPTPSMTSHDGSSHPSHSRLPRRYTGSYRSYRSSGGPASPASSRGARRTPHLHQSVQPMFMFPQLGSQQISPNTPFTMSILDPETRQPISIPMLMVPAATSPRIVSGMSHPPVSHPPTEIQYPHTSFQASPSNVGDSSLMSR